MKRHMVFSGVRKLTTGALLVLLLLLVLPSRALADSKYYTVKVDKGYLALRTAPVYDEKNEIGELYTGDVVRLVDSKSNATYWKVYSDKYGKKGWVNKNYLVSLKSLGNETYKVTVSKGYLALRTAPAYDEKNEIGELYTGDTVVLLSKYNNKYWWVYSPKYNRNGYVNKDYLSFLSASASTYGDYRVSVAKGYLALRTAPSYNEKNEIGELYTGDVVNVLDKSNGQYWWVYSYKYGKKGYVNKDYLVR